MTALFWLFLTCAGFAALALWLDKHLTDEPTCDLGRLLLDDDEFARLEVAAADHDFELWAAELGGAS